MGKQVSVPLSVQHRIEAVVDDCVKKAEARYGKMIKTPEVRYELTGAVAGRAHHRHDWYIDINSVLLVENLEDMIHNTVPHEMAHMICAVVYPETLAPREKVMTRSGRMKREKREVHGPRFYEVCDVLGMDEASRTHNYDVTNSKKKVDKTIHEYVCLGCTKDINVTAKRHTMLLNGTRKYVCAACKGPIALKQNIRMTMVGNQPVQVVRAHRPATKPGPTGDSKLAKCWRLYKQYHDRYGRKQMIAIFYNEADCTPAGASTYYAQCQKLYREGHI